MGEGGRGCRQGRSPARILFHLVAASELHDLPSTSPVAGRVWLSNLVLGVGFMSGMGARGWGSMILISWKYFGGIFMVNHFGYGSFLSLFLSMFLVYLVQFVT